MAIDSGNTVKTSFWLNIAAEKVYGSLETAQKAADSLKQVIVWVLGVYSTISFAGVIWAKKEDWNPYGLLIMGIAFVLLVLAYVQSNRATFPVKMEFHPTEEKNIKEVHSASVTYAYEKLTLALRLCSIGVILYCVAILIQFAQPAFCKFSFCKEEKKEIGRQKGTDSLSVKILVDPRQLMLHVNLQSKKNSWVKLKVEWDSVINKRRTTYPAFQETDFARHEHWIFVDSSMVQNVNIPYMPHGSLYLSVIRTDTLKKDVSFKSYHIRTKVTN